MPDAADLTRAAAGGTVLVADRAFPVAPLGVAGEEALVADLRRLARDQLGPLGALARHHEPLAELLRANSPHYPHYLRQVIAANDQPDRGADWRDALDTPAGTALELWHRARPLTPGLALADCQALVTDANAADVRRQMEAAVTAQHKSPAAG